MPRAGAGTSRAGLEMGLNEGGLSPRLARDGAWGVIALPLLARLYVRAKDLPGIEPRHRPAFRTKLELAVELVRWAKCWLGFLGKPL